MTKMTRKIREDLRFLAETYVDLKAFELRARVYFAASRSNLGAADSRNLMREAVSVFVAVKTPVERERPTNVVAHPKVAKHAG
jgi:hypothetical protein